MGYCPLDVLDLIKFSRHGAAPFRLESRHVPLSPHVAAPGSGEAAQDPTALLEQLARQQTAPAQASTGSSGRVGSGPAPQSAATRPISQSQAPASGVEALAISPLQALGEGASSTQAAPITIDRSTHVTLPNAQFGAGVSRAEMESAFHAGIARALAERDDETAREIEELANSGRLRNV